MSRITYISGACSQRQLLYSFEGSKIQSFVLPYLLNLIVLYLFFLTSQTSSDDVSSENGWLGFYFLGAKVAK